MKSTYVNVVMVLFEFDMIPLWFCLAGKYMNLKTFAKLVTQKFADKSDFLALLQLFVLQLFVLQLFVLQLKRDLLSFFHYKLYNLSN